MRVLCIEPSFATKFPPLGLMKLSAYHKSMGDEVVFYKGNMKPNGIHYEIIYITSLFTWFADCTIDCIKHYQKHFKKSQIQVGGIFATLMPEMIYEKTGIRTFCGYKRELENILPDYSLMKKGTYKDDYSYVFTTRACPNKCKFCAVETLDGQFWVNPEWKKQVDPSKKRIVVFDNNITGSPYEHFEDVMSYICEHNLSVKFENGVDIRFTTPKHAKWLAKIDIEYEGMKIAFDTPATDGLFQRKVKMLQANGVKGSDMATYTLCNFNDTVEEAHYRCRQSVTLGLRPIPLFYIPLDHTNPRQAVRMNANWTNDIIANFKHFYTRGGMWRKKCFWDWIKDPNRETYVSKEIPLVTDFEPDRTSKWYRPHEEEIYMGKESLDLESYLTE